MEPYSFANLVNSIVKRLAPKNDFGDKLYASIEFLMHFKRWPKHTYLFSDYHYALKTSRELASPLRAFVSDKEYAKIYIKSIVGDKYNVPTLAILKTSSDIYRYEFPENCCIKPTHASGRVIFRQKQSYIDLQKINSWLKLNYYERYREKNYRQLIPRIIVEPIIFDDMDLTDYKIFCYKGKPNFIVVDIDRYGRRGRKIFDVNWNLLPFSLTFPQSDKTVVKPRLLNEMLEVSAKISENFSLMRVDCYTNGEQVLVGELTNLNGAGLGRILPPSLEYEASKVLFGDLVDGMNRKGSTGRMSVAEETRMSRGASRNH